jgi:hypothetical protein
VLIQGFVITCYFFKSVTHAFQRSFSNVTVKITVEYSEYVFFDRIDPMVGYSNDQSKPFMPFSFFFLLIFVYVSLFTMTMQRPYAGSIQYERKPFNLH